MRLPDLRLQRNAGVGGHRLDMRLGIARSADNADAGDGVQERLARQNVGRFQVLVHHFDDAPARPIGELPTLAIGRGNGGAAGERQAQRFGNRVHGAGRAHGIAMSRTRGAGCGAVEKFLLVYLARCQLAPAAPDDGPAADQFAFVPAVEHRAARQDDGRDIDGGGSHDLARRGLVAPGGQHHAVDGIAVQELDQTEVKQVAIERGGGPAAIFEDRVDREFDRDAARIADAVARPLGKVDMDAVAGRKVAAALRDADDRLAAAQLLRRDAVVHEPLQIERGHVHPLRIVEPVAAAQSRARSWPVAAHFFPLSARLGPASELRRTSV